MPKKPDKMGKGCPKSDSQAPGPSLTVLWNRVYQKTKTEQRRLREYRLPPDTTVFRIVQCDREKGTLYGDFDHLERKERDDLIHLVREIIEGKPPAGYSPTAPLITKPSPFYLRTRGKLKRIELGPCRRPVTAEQIGDRMTVIDANARPSNEAIKALARLLVDSAKRKAAEARSNPVSSVEAR
jgi:hypothetical protein